MKLKSLFIKCLTILLIATGYSQIQAEEAQELYQCPSFSHLNLPKIMEKSYTLSNSSGRNPELNTQYSVDKYPKVKSRYLELIQEGISECNGQLTTQQKHCWVYDSGIGLKTQLVGGSIEAEKIYPPTSKPHFNLFPKGLYAVLKSYACEPTNHKSLIDNISEKLNSTAEDLEFNYNQQDVNMQNIEKLQNENKELRTRLNALEALLNK